MFKAFVGKLTCGVALLVGFVACGAGSEEAYEELDAPSAAEAISEENSTPAQDSVVDAAALLEGADTSASVDPSGLVFVDCYANLVTCFPDRDAIFEQTGVVCVCQAPDLDQFCGSSLVDLECNL